MTAAEDSRKGPGWLPYVLAVVCGAAVWFGIQAASQVVYYFAYPNVSGELPSLFPIAAAFLFAATLPAIGAGYAGAVLRRRASAPHRRSSDPR